MTLTANSSALGHVSYEAESTWGENVTTFANRLPVVELPALNLTQPRIETGIVSQYKNDGVQGVKGVQGGSFTTRFRLTGHGSTCAGSISATDLPTLLGYVFAGTSEADQSGTTLTGGTAAVPTTTASGTFAAGDMCRIGSIGDGRGNGQFYAITTHVTTTLTLKNAMAGAPNAGDVMYSPELVFPAETPTSSQITGLRFLIATANLRYECHGCFATAARIVNTSPMGVPEIEIDWGVSWWQPEASSTFPATDAINEFYPAPVAAGSLWFNDYGTTTNARYDAVAFNMSIDLGTVPTRAVGAANAYQTIIGATRTRCQASIDFTIDAEAATASPAWLTKWNAQSTYYHCLYTLSAADGTAVGIYFPRIAPVGDKPTQVAVEGLNRVKASFKCLTDVAAGATDRLKSNFRIAFA